MSEIVNKLKLGKYTKGLVLNKPADVYELDTLKLNDKAENAKYDLVFIFVFSLDEFVGQLSSIVKQDLIQPGGSLFFVYPKKGNKKYKEYIGRDDIFPRIDVDDDGYVKGSLLKFYKMLAFNEIFTLVGLKHEEKRKSRKNQLSQCVADYIERIPDLQTHFADNSDILTFFNNLTPGYQRGWARFVYSTKSEATITKRLSEMADIIRQGYKSIDLYRAAKR